MDQGQLTRYRNAILGGALPAPASNAPAATPELAPAFANIQALGASNMQGNVARKSVNAFGGAAQSVANENEAAAKLRLQEEEEKAAAIDKQRKDLLDPTKYRQEIAEDGGYRFYDPEGNEIDVKRFSGATGKHITEVLKKSQNPEDRQFVQDYQDVEELGEIMNAGDKKRLEKFYEKHPDFKERKKDTYAKIVGDFRKYYPKFFNEEPSTTVQTKYGEKTPASIGGGENGFAKLLKGIFGN